MFFCFHANLSKIYGMKVFINNNEVETSASHLSDLMTQLGFLSIGYAVAVQGLLVPRSEWKTFQLSQDMRLTIIKAACGG